MEQLPVIVSIRCLAYNHEPYIRECLEGFVMQQTNFRFEAIVHDDASTDGTADIIREYAEKYPDIIKPIFETENQYSKHDGSLGRIMRVACTGKYIAMCEGDDYWTDPLKLQKQVDFMEEHEDYSLCCHRYRIFNEFTKEWEPDYVAGLFEENPEGFSFTSNDNLHCWITKTMTMMYRKSALPENYQKGYRYCRDVHMNYHLLQNGPGYCMPDDMAVYRKQQGGVFSSLNDKEKKRINLLIYHEILMANPSDVELGIYLKACYDRYFGNFVRKPIYDHQISREVRKDIRLVVDGYKFWMGCKSMLFVMKKCVKSYFSGFRRKNG